MLNPLPSSFQGEERETYVLETAKRLCDEWNFLPPKDYDKDKIRDYLKKRDEYLGTNLDIIWTTSPKLLESSLRSSLDSSLWSSLDSSLDSSLWSSLDSSLESSLNSSLWSSLDSSLWSSLDSSLRSSIRSSLRSSIRSSLGSSLDSSLWSWYGFLFWDIYYQFNEDPEIKNFVQFLPDAYSSGLGFAVITDKKFYALPMPDYYLNRENRLHKDLAPAVVWPDGEKEFYLNSVKCPEYIVMTKAEDIDCNQIVKEGNAEVRREMVRKIGIERVCYKLHAKCIDKKGDYELLLLDIGDNRKRPYLKMLNPSIGIWHVEGVHPSCENVEQALRWRNQDNKETEILT